MSETNTMDLIESDRSIHYRESDTSMYISFILDITVHHVQYPYRQIRGQDQSVDQPELRLRP